MPTVREYEAAMERNPSDTEAFVALRKAYRQAQKHDRLVTLYEARAQAIEDNAKAGELFYLAAELRIDQLGDAEGAEADLVNAVDRDPSHIRAAARLKDIYREQGRTADYMTMLEMEAAAVARTRDPARIAELEAEMSQLFLNHFARLERAVRNPQKTGKLAQEHVRSIESARKIYRALGDYRAVVRLYELELEGTQDARRRADLLLGLGRVLGEKLEELDAAAQRLAEVVRLRPRDEKALELLAGVYANPNWIGADGVDRAAAIYYQIARRRQEAERHRKRDRGAAPRAARPSRRTRNRRSCSSASTTTRAGSRSSIVSTASASRSAAVEAERIDFLYKRAQLAGGGARRRGRGAARLQRDLAAGAGGRARVGEAGRAVPRAARSTRSWPSCASASWARSRIRSSGRTRCWSWPRCTAIGWATAIRRPSTCTRCWRSSPRTRSRSAPTPSTSARRGTGRRWPICWSSPSSARGWRGSATDELLPRLEEIATVSEKQLGDAERAIAAWQRAEEIAPTYTRAREAQRRLLLKSKSWDRLAALLEREAAAQTDPGQRAEILRRAAQIYREKLGNAARAIEIYKDILKRRSARTRCRCAPSSRPTSARATSSAWRQLLREQIDRADDEAGTRRAAAPRAGHLRRADRRPRAGAVGGERDPARRCRAIATR